MAIPFRATSGPVMSKRSASKESASKKVRAYDFRLICHLSTEFSALGETSPAPTGRGGCLLSPVVKLCNISIWFCAIFTLFVERFL